MRESGWLVQGLDFLFPRQCCGCGAVLHAMGEQGLCWDCRSGSIPIVAPTCRHCGVGVAGRIDHAFTCLRCQEDPPAFDRAFSLFRYEGGVREAIHALKYHHDFSVIPDLAALLEAGLRVHVPDLEGLTLVPVPLHRRKQRQRGFNQSRELADVLRRWVPGLGLWTGLRRVKNTETQTHLSAAGRRDNVRAAFRVAPRAKDSPARALLVDDVMTTGATLDACAKALRRAGVREILAMTLARG